MPKGNAIRVAGLAVAAIAFGAALAGAATTTAPGSVTPKVGGPTSSFAIRFTTPIATGEIGKSIVYEEIQGTNARWHALQGTTSCLSTFQVDASYGSAGSQVGTTVRPSTRWCTGRWGLDVLELKAPICLVQGTCPNTVRHEIGYIDVSAKFKVK